MVGDCCFVLGFIWLFCGYLVCFVCLLVDLLVGCCLEVIGWVCLFGCDTLVVLTLCSLFYWLFCFRWFALH